MLKVLELDDENVDIQIVHSAKFASAEEAEQSPAAKVVSVGFRFLDAVLNGTITEETKVRDFYRAENAKPTLIVLPSPRELER